MSLTGKLLGLMALALLLGACAGMDAINLASGPAARDSGSDTLATAFTEEPGTSSPAAGSGTATPQDETAVAAIRSDARVEFAPVIGATAEALPPLSNRLSARARQLGMTLARGSDASFIMKGYFSAVADGDQTSVIYVWDVLDPAGNRLHRIQGQQKAPGDGEEGWNSVTPATMEAIADRTIDELAAWLNRHSS